MTKMSVSLDLEEFNLSESLEDLGGGIFALPDEDVVEDLLSEKLIIGYMLLEKPCPNCFIPLVKKPIQQDNLVSPTSRLSDCLSVDSADELHPRVVPAASLERIPKPINGLPHCVICDTYLVTTKSEVEILAKLEQMQLPNSVNGGDESTMDTRALMELGANIGSSRTATTYSVTSPSSAGLSKQTNNNMGSMSVLFQQSFSMHKKLSSPKHSRNDIPSSASTTSSVKSIYNTLRGKHLTGIAASQEDQGVEMKLDAAPVQADNALSQETPVREGRDDDLDNISALWKFVGSGSSRVGPELALREVADEDEEGSQTPNLDLLHHESSVDSESMQPSPAAKNTAALAQQQGTAKTIETSVEDGQQQQEDIGIVDSESGDGDDNMIIVSDSIHYIETEGQEMPLLDKHKYSEEEGADTENEGEECTLAEDNDNEEPSEEEEESTEETANTGITTDPSHLPLSESEEAVKELKGILEAERNKVTKSSTADTDAMLTDLEEFYASKSSCEEEVLSAASEESRLFDTMAKLQQDIARVLKDVDSEPESQPSPVFQVLYSTSKTLEQVDEVTQTTLGCSKSQTHEVEMPEFKSNTLRGEIEVVANDLSSILALENAAPTYEEIESLTGFDSILKDSPSRDTSRTETTAASKGSMSAFDDEIMQEYTVR
jgi:Sjogren's syndrome/scleroderma autoantigen 1 (Autoantigen p27)